MQSKKTLALGLLIAFSASSAQAGFECFSKAWEAYKTSWSTLVKGGKTEDGKADLTMGARLTAGLPAVGSTAAVIGVVGYLVYRNKAKIQAQVNKLLGKKEEAAAK